MRRTLLTKSSILIQQQQQRCHNNSSKWCIATATNTTTTTTTTKIPTSIRKVTSTISSSSSSSTTSRSGSSSSSSFAIRSLLTTTTARSSTSTLSSSCPYSFSSSSHPTDRSHTYNNNNNDNTHTMLIRTIRNGMNQNGYYYPSMVQQQQRYFVTNNDNDKTNDKNDDNNTTTYSSSTQYNPSQDQKENTMNDNDTNTNDQNDTTSSSSSSKSGSKKTSSKKEQEEIERKKNLESIYEQIEVSQEKEWENKFKRIDETPEFQYKDEAHKLKLQKLAKEYGVNLDGTQIEDEPEINEDDIDDGKPPDHNDDDLYGTNNVNAMQQKMNDTSQHRATNIGVPTRPEDPVPVDGKTVHVMFCYSKYEIMDGTRFEDNVGQFHLPLSYDAIKKEALEFYNEEEDAEYFSLEYYHKKKWHPLNEDSYPILLHYHEQQILYKDEKQTMLFIRLPFMYDTSDYPEEDPYGGGASAFNSLADAAMGNFKDGKTPKPPPTLQDKIIEVLDKLQERNFQRDLDTSPSPYDLNSDITQYQLIVPKSEFEQYDLTPINENEDEPIVISTRQYILNLTASDYDLRDILLLNVNALNHFVRCLHYDIYWDYPLPKRSDIDPSESNNNDDNNNNYDYNDDDEEGEEAASAGSGSHGGFYDQDDRDHLDFENHEYPKSTRQHVHTADCKH